MSFFRNPRVIRVLRPAVAVLAGAAAVWHAIHAVSAWKQSRQYRTTDPSLADYFGTAAQVEVGVVVAAMVSGMVGWAIFRPRGDQ